MYMAAVVGPEGVIGEGDQCKSEYVCCNEPASPQEQLVALLKKGSGFGEITWDGVDPRYVTLTKIPRTIKVSKGDTVVTSPYSDIFPAGQVVGYVEDVAEEKIHQRIQSKVRTATNFYSIQHDILSKTCRNRRWIHCCQK
jgi:rod shape-determining protein MreC